jgi:hypothetical protein
MRGIGALTLTLAWLGGPALAASTVPFVGCAADGMFSTDQDQAPSGHPATLQLPSDIAAKLGVYASTDWAVLAPRGWACREVLANDAHYLITFPPIHHLHEKVETSIVIGSWGEITGLRTALVIGGLYFPRLVSKADIKQFLNDMGDDDVPVAKFLGKRFRSEKLTYLSQSALEFETPPNTSGFEHTLFGGASPFTQYGIVGLNLDQNKGDAPGVYNESSGLTFIIVNLPPDLAHLTPYILEMSRPCILNGDNASSSMHGNINYANQ